MVSLILSIAGTISDVDYGTDDALIFKDMMTLSIAGFLMLFWLVGNGIYRAIRLVKRADLSYRATGTCIELRSRIVNGQEEYSPVYQIQVNGRTTTTRRDVYESPMPVKVGDQLELWVNPHSPEGDYIYTGKGLRAFRKKSGLCFRHYILFTLIAISLLINIGSIYRLIMLLQK